ncbi:MAG: pyruvate kinase [Chloroflexi bacterium]|nr:pyruvate kinase [Chloroflexota bacterium]
MKYFKNFDRRTRIVCTIGPATSSAAMIESLVRSGMNVARLNLSHGSHVMHSRYVSTVRRIARRLGTTVAVLMDLPGPKYRIGRLKGGQVTLKKGNMVTLTIEDIEGDSSTLPVNLPDLPRDIKIGDTVLLDDGALQLRAVQKSATEVIAKVVAGGLLTENRGLVVPGMPTSGPFITGALREHIRFAVQEKPDYVALSFVSSVADVAAVRAIFCEQGADIPIIAKIERVQAVNDFDAILAASDGIMVARGDLGVDIPLEKVPLVQKHIIQKCNRAGKPVITATQMLESMTAAARPTRAEVTDVANAIFDGTDATMLSAETSVGKHPVQALRTMSRIALEADKRLPYQTLLVERGEWIERQTDELIAYSACHIARTLEAAAVVAFTQSGSTAARVSKYRPGVPILAITHEAAIMGRLVLNWGTYPFLIAEPSSLDELFNMGVKIAGELKLTRPGQFLVITGGVPIGVAGATNLLKVERIGSPAPSDQALCPPR